MGITSLLVFLRHVTHSVTLKKYKGCCIGVDAMCWMHRGAVASASDLLLKGIPGPQFIKFVMKMVQLLLDYDIRPILVFDGRHIPVKADEDDVRQLRRDTAAKEARQLLKSGVSRNDPKVRSKIVQAIRVTTDMIRRLMLALRMSKIEFLVSPYEADAQLAFLCRAGIVDAVITEDSDLLAYGCPRVLFKLNSLGEGQEIDIASVFKPLSHHPIKLPIIEPNQLAQDTDKHVTSSSTTEIDRVCGSPIQTLKNWVIRQEWKVDHSHESNDDDTNDIMIRSTLSPNIPKTVQTETDIIMGYLTHMTLPMFTAMCVLTGSDYTTTSHIKGIGIKKACQLILKYQTLTNVFDSFLIDPKWKKLIKQMNQSINLPIVSVSQQGTCENKVFLSHLIAEFVFTFHQVYDPRINRIIAIGEAECCSTELSKRCIFPETITLLNITIPVESILGTIEKNEYRLFQHAAGENTISNTSTVAFSEDEHLVMSDILTKERQLSELQSWDQSQKEKQRLKKFKAMFQQTENTHDNNIDDNIDTSLDMSIKPHSIRSNIGGGTGLMERLYLSRTPTLLSEKSTSQESSVCSTTDKNTEQFNPQHIKSKQRKRNTTKTILFPEEETTILKKSPNAISMFYDEDSSLTKPKRAKKLSITEAFKPAALDVTLPSTPQCFPTYSNQQEKCSKFITEMYSYKPIEAPNTLPSAIKSDGTSVLARARFSEKIDFMTRAKFGNKR